MKRSEIMKILTEYKKVAQNKYRFSKIGIFGSYARDEATSSSDIDIVVELETQDLFNLIGIKQDLEQRFNNRVDIVSYRKKMNSFLKNRINREVLYV
jgi:predicted nucleotidyltransferase